MFAITYLLRSGSGISLKTVRHSVFDCTQEARFAKIGHEMRDSDKKEGGIRDSRKKRSGNAESGPPPSPLPDPLSRLCEVGTAGKISDYQLEDPRFNFWPSQGLNFGRPPWTGTLSRSMGELKRNHVLVDRSRLMLVLWSVSALDHIYKMAFA